jgi:hypothetical protein
LRDGENGVSDRRGRRIATCMRTYKYLYDSLQAGTLVASPGSAAARGEPISNDPLPGGQPTIVANQERRR